MIHLLWSVAIAVTPRVLSTVREILNTFGIGLCLTIFLLCRGVLTEAKPIDKTCSRCSIEGGITCEVTELPYPCFLPDKEYKDFPHKPRNLTVDKHLHDNSSWHLHVSWMLPYDYSYSVVTGFEMVVDSIMHMSHVKVQPMRCFYFNLSHVDWSTVQDVHNVKIHFDCLEYPALHRRNVAITMYSLPKASRNSEYITSNIYLPEMSQEPMWAPKIIMDPKDDGLKLRFTPPFNGAEYHAVCIKEGTLKDIRNKCLGGIHKVEKGENELFVPEIQSNNTYNIMIRPYNALNNSLDSWVSKSYFFPPQKVKEYVDMETKMKEPATNNDSLVVMLVCMAIVVIVSILILVVILRRRSNLSCSFCMMMNRFYNTDDRSNVFFRKCQAEVMAIYIPQPEIFNQVVSLHTSILKDTDRMKIEEGANIGGCSEDEDRDRIDKLIKNYQRGDRKEIIIYVSERLLSCLSACYDDEIHMSRQEKYCTQLLKRLSEKTRRNTRKPYVLCFGDAKRFGDLGSVLKAFRPILSVVEFSADSVSMANTISLIKSITNDSSINFEPSHEDVCEFRKKVIILLRQRYATDDNDFCEHQNGSANNYYSRDDFLQNEYLPYAAAQDSRQAGRNCSPQLFTSGYRTCEDARSPVTTSLEIDEFGDEGERGPFIGPSSVCVSESKILAALEQVNEESCWTSAK